MWVSQLCVLFYTDGQGQAEGTLDGAIHMYTRSPQLGRGNPRTLVSGFMLILYFRDTIYLEHFPPPTCRLGVRAKNLNPNGEFTDNESETPHVVSTPVWYTSCTLWATPAIYILVAMISTYLHVGFVQQPCQFLCRRTSIGFGQGGQYSSCHLVSILGDRLHIRWP